MPEALRQELAREVSVKLASIPKNGREVFQRTASQLPVLIRTAGFHKALRYYQDQVNQKGNLPTEERKMQGAFLNALSQIVLSPADGNDNFAHLRKRIEEAELGEYQYLAYRVLLALEWFQRFLTSLEPSGKELLDDAKTADDLSFKQSKRITTLDSLKTPPPESGVNASLWLDKFARTEDGTDEEKTQLVDQVVKIAKGAQPGYADFYQRWKKALSSRGAKLKTAEVNGRLAINLGAASLIETSIALNRAYGMPYIPGSALKGLTAHYAAKNDPDWCDKNFVHLFGGAGQAGYVVFFDALYIPDIGPNQKPPLWADVMTPHHMNYYAGKDEPPADWDSPTPVPFLTAQGKFLVALAGPEAWVDAALTILDLALENEGIGAKTSSGYGRMSLKDYKL